MAEKCLSVFEKLVFLLVDGELDAELSLPDRDGSEGRPLPRLLAGSGPRYLLWNG